MQIPESWLRSFVDPALSTDELAEMLTMRGLEVEDVRALAPAFTGIVVGEVVEVARHPNADRLSVCRVRTTADPAQANAGLQIVCGAPNVRVGIKVPCALVGATLPPAKPGDAPFPIKRATMRGVDSEGMLCSARELHLSDDHAGLLILPDDTQVGAALGDVLDLDDHVLTLKLTPNKADCLSVLGVAREVAAFSGASLKLPSFAPAPVSMADKLPVRVLAPDLCGRFSGRIVRGLDATAATPAWMKQRLERSGQRSVSALVDISNYIMLELGRPTHVFDLAKIHGGLEVRWGRKGETLQLLNGDTVEVDETVGVIADDEAVESLAGIMGGEASAVSLATIDIYIEAAFWWPNAIRGRARRYGFATDASHRFERGVDFSTTVEHIERITQLVLDVCGTQETKVGPVDDQVIALPENKPVRMRVARAIKVIGVPISAAEIATLFMRFGLAFTREGEGEKEVFVVTPPPYRFDLEIEEDLIEEVARGHGYKNIPAHLPIARHVTRVTPEARRSIHDLADALAARDYREVLNFSFVEPAWERDFAANDNPIRLLNPIASQLAVMRSSLIGSLVANVRFNLNRKASRVRVFEIAKVYLRDETIEDGPLAVAGIAQPLRVGAIAYGPAVDEQWGVATCNVDYFDVKADIEALFAPLGRHAAPRFSAAAHPALHPGRSARIESAGKAVGWIGELHPRWMQRHELPQAPVLFEIDAGALTLGALPEVAAIPRFPLVIRDRAFVVDAAIEVQTLVDAIASLRVAARASGEAAQCIREVELFDQYRGKGLNDNEKSLAFRFWLQDTRQTLDDATIDAALNAVSEVLAAAAGARLRA